MSAQTEALLRLKAFFESNSIRYMIIGGPDNTVWGRPRLSYDTGVKDWADIEGIMLRRRDKLDHDYVLGWLPSLRRYWSGRR